MHRFVLLDLLLQFLSENIALVGDDIRRAIAVGLLQLARVFEFLQFVLKNLQTRFQLSVEKRQRFDLLSIASEVLIFPVRVVLGEKSTPMNAKIVSERCLLVTVDFCSVHRSPPSSGPSLGLGLWRIRWLRFDIYSVNPFEHLKLQKRQRTNERSC